MKKTHLLAAVVALAAVGILTADASAMYHPALGRFVQRDPGPGGPMRVGPAETAARIDVTQPDRSGGYADGMNLYQYLGSNPPVYVDPSGEFRRYVCCNQNQINMIQRDEARGLQQIQGLQGRIQAGLAADKGQYPAFTGSALRKALSYLNTAADAIRNKAAKCEPPGASRLCNDGAIAWQKWIFGRTVHLCPIYFGYGPNFRAATLVHEGTHFAGTLDVRYFTHHREWPHRVWLTGWHDIASTYDTWILCGFCIPGHNCVGRAPRVNPNL